MKFFDEICEEFKSKIHYQPLVKMVVENRRLEMINIVSRHFDADLDGNDLLTVCNQIKEIERKTASDLLHLRRM